MIQVSDGALTSLSNVLRVQIDLHFTKVQEILFKNFCSLAPVAIAVRSEERVTDIVCVALSIFSAPVALYLNVLGDKSELHFRNICQSFSRISAYFFQCFTFLRHLALFYAGDGIWTHTSKKLPPEDSASAVPPRLRDVTIVCLNLGKCKGKNQVRW